MRGGASNNQPMSLPEDELQPTYTPNLGARWNAPKQGKVLGNIMFNPKKTIAPNGTLATYVESQQSRNARLRREQRRVVNSKESFPRY